jgi:glycosyltransferase involved in cell wall biosynthesis
MLSIIIPLYNKQDTIQKTIDSVIAQSYVDWELIIVDDGSTDQSVDRVNARLDSRIKILRKENGGPAAARNFGVDHASGEWVAFLDADDFFLSGAFEEFNRLIQKYPNVNCFSCNFMSESGDLRCIYSPLIKEGIVRNNFKAWFWGTCFPRAGAAIYRKDVLLRHPMKPYLRRYEDAESIFAIFREEKFCTSPTPVMVYNNNSLCASGKRADIKEDYLGYIKLENCQSWEKLVLYGLYKQAKSLYPIESKQLYPGYSKLWMLDTLYSLLFIVKKFRNKIDCILLYLK